MTLSQTDFPALHGPGDEETGLSAMIRGHRLYPFSHKENPLGFFLEGKRFRDQIAIHDALVPGDPF
jgi:hypothetical protein